jgi:hypothetical protein
VDVIAFARNHFHSRARANQRDHRNPHLLRANRDKETHEHISSQKSILRNQKEHLRARVPLLFSPL